jgi:hypothetical protein
LAIGLPAAGGPDPSDTAVSVGKALRLERFTTQELQLPAGRPQELDVVVNLDGVARTMRLRPHSVRSEIFEVLAPDDDGVLRPVEVPPPATYRGEIVGQPGARVAASLVNGQLQATIDVGDEDLWWVQPATDVAPASPPSLHVVYRGSAVAPGPWTCGNTPAIRPADDEPAPPRPPTAAAVTLQQTEIAFDADYDFYISRGSSTANVTADIETILNSVQLIYEGDAGITYLLTTVIVRTNPVTDPYVSTGASDLLNEVGIEWNTFQVGVPRDLAHLMTGKDLNGSTIGIAALASVCVNNVAYGLSQSGWTGNWAERVSLTAHEIGHNWSALHCNGQVDCAIMCAGVGGCTGELLRFGSSSRTSITAYRDVAACLFPILTGPKPNIVWRHLTTGHNSIWLVDGQSIPLSSSLTSVRDQDWKVVGCGDFNGDGNSDVMWRHQVTGKNTLWHLSGINVVGWGALPDVASAAWRVAGTGDFDGDGNADILWRHAITGSTVIWFLNGNSVVGFGPVSTVADLNMEIAGTGDFDNDGMTDILWRHAITGANTVWLMNGTTITSTGSLPDQADTDWQVAGIGDFNGDGNADILWRHAVTGANAVWFINGTAFIGWGPLSTLAGTNWIVAGVFDADGDGNADILWRHTRKGKNAVWFVVGSTVVAWAPLPSATPGWVVAATSD